MASIFTLKRNEGTISEGKDGRPVYDPPKKQFLERQTEYEDRVDEYNKQYQSALKRWERSVETQTEATQAESEASASASASAKEEASARAEQAKQEAILEAEKRKTMTKRASTSAAAVEIPGLSGLSTSLPVAQVGGGAVAGWLVGAQIGSIGGPLGAAVGAGVGYFASKVLASE